MQGFIIQESSEKQVAADAVMKLDVSKKWEVIIKPFKRNRSLRQNALMWAIYNQLEEQTGVEAEYYHIYFKGRFLGVQEMEIMGEQKRIAKSTKRLDKTQFAEYMTKVIAAITEAGYYIEMPYDYKEVFR